MDSVHSKGVVSPVVLPGDVSDKPANDYCVTFQRWGSSLYSLGWIYFISSHTQRVRFVSNHVFPWINWLWSFLFAETVQVKLCGWFWIRVWKIRTTLLRHWTWPWLFSQTRVFYHASHTLWLFCWIERHLLCLDSVSESCEFRVNVFNSSRVWVRQFIGCFI